MSDIHRIPSPVSRPPQTAQKSSSSSSSSSAPKFTLPPRQDADAASGLDGALDLFVFQPAGLSGDGGGNSSSGGGSGGSARKEPESTDDTDDLPPEVAAGPTGMPVNVQRMPLERTQKVTTADASAFVASLSESLPDGAESGIFEVALPDGRSMGVAVNSQPELVSYLINPLTPQLASDLRQQRMELEGRLARRISRNVRIAVL